MTLMTSALASLVMTSNVYAAEGLSGRFVRSAVTCGPQVVEPLDPIRTVSLDFEGADQVRLILSDRAGCRVLRWGSFETNDHVMKIQFTGGCGVCLDRALAPNEAAFAGAVSAGFGVFDETLLIFRRDVKLDRGLCPSPYLLTRQFTRTSAVAPSLAEVRAEVCAP